MTDLSTVEQPARSATANSAIGVVFILAGFFVLADVTLATTISTLLLGVVVVCAGFVEITMAIWAGGWRGFLWQTFLGILYVIFGCVLISIPVLGSVILTWILGIALVVSGVGRIFLGNRYLRSGRRLMFVSGLFGLAAGLLILVGWPSTGIWVIGALLGIDLIAHGLGWLAAARRSAVSA
ncbi:DUF308 domain-containing protein [Mesorhizobium sp. AR07]|uniref:HdeD family acid-resistance protein n=1 Tax=Mesorhizobium sp. AR07 TaxID=2865838 RepID=UPI00215E6CB0|nr:DUF308 domain-containing protein [Mesorhizobium sp. AR07]UVK42897.1 DUF308 domain-containing protein [Mesorhizobium sp. AR07]